ncbi:MAG: CYTH domain-containing protein [Firmicutes bacterium]|nr:CYTH domain-containing protein [Bacillota bacterium]MBR0481951.1 CYTH domain-containing protein [Bacillota bacterium]
MEQETKYTIKDGKTADLIWEEVLSGKYGEAIGPESVYMEGAYFDTPGRVLKKNNVALRVRCEGAICFATLKWGGNKAVQGLHEHQEVNIPVDTDSCLIAPPVDIFEDSIDGRKMSDLVGDEPLEMLFETLVTRRRAKIHYRSSVVELAIDIGSVVAGEKEESISEMEIELYSGQLSDVLDLTQDIAERHGLTPEDRSKYARAVALLEKEYDREEEWKK